MIIRIDHKIRIARSDLPDHIIEHIQQALTIPNLEREKAMKQGIWGWDKMPEYIELYDWDWATSHLIMPRGFLTSLLAGLDELGVSYSINDCTTFEQCEYKFGKKIDLRRWQAPAVEYIIMLGNGIWKAPAGSGKTVGILEVVRRLNVPSIILVTAKDILYQWRDRARSFLGDDYPVGLIGDGKFEISDYLTVATVQTLHRRFDALSEAGFFEQFSFMCLDECHHASAQTYRRVVDRFSASYRTGVSATPDKTGNFALIRNILGPVIHETRREDVDTIIDPTIFKVSTDFEFLYTHNGDYASLLDWLTINLSRNALIAKSIMMEAGSHSLVISKRLNHLEQIYDMLRNMIFPDPILFLTGQESSAIRAAVIEYASKYPCVVLSTLADEALDIPRLDRLFLIFPQRNAGLIEQQVGRIARVHPDKKDAKVFDFADLQVGPLAVQWINRRNQVYKRHGYSVITVSSKDIMEYDLDHR
jgi:superfamily II DNA or RNA helicase